MPLKDKVLYKADQRARYVRNKAVYLATNRRWALAHPEKMAGYSLFAKWVLVGV